MLTQTDLRNYLSFGFQSAKGTAVAPTDSLAFVEALQFNQGQQFTQVREGGSGPNVDRTIKNSYLPGARGAIAGRPSITAKVMAALLGDDTVTGVGPYTHTIIGDADNDWLTLERSIADAIVERQVDAVVAEVEVDIRRRDQGPEVLVIANLMALSPTFEAAATAESYDALDPFVRSECAWTIDGAANTNIERARMRWRWIYDSQLLADAVTRQDLVKVRFEADVEATLMVATSAERDLYRKIQYGSAAGTGAVETVHTSAFIANFTRTGYQAQFEIPEVAWTRAEYSEPDPNGEATRLTVAGNAQTKSDGSPIVRFTAQNDDTAAYV